MFYGTDDDAAVPALERLITDAGFDPACLNASACSSSSRWAKPWSTPAPVPPKPH